MAFDPLNMSPYGWIPDAWAQPAPMQPGIGIPQSTVDEVAPQIQQDAEIEMQGYAPEPPEIEMANMDMRPNVGFPRLVEDAPAELPAAMPVDEPLPEVDAISGVGPIIPAQPSDMAAGGLQPGLGIPMAAFDAAADFAARPPDWRSAGDNALENPVGELETDAKSYANATPEQRANMQFELVQNREAEERKRMSEAALADAERAENEHKAHLESRAKAAQDRQALEMDAKKLAETNIDPEKWWSDRSTGQKVAAFIAAIAGGLVQPHGGKNSGLAAIDTMIDRDIDAQKANMANKRAELQRRGGAINDAAAIEAEDYREQTMFRVASYERIKTQISTEMQNFDPRGTSRIKLGEIYVGIEGQRQAALAAMEAAKRKKYLEDAKLKQDQEKIDIDRAKMEAAAQAALLKARGSGGGKTIKPEDEIKSPEELARLHPTISADLIPPDGMSLRNFSSHLERLGKGGTAAKAVREGSVEERARELGVPGLVQADGKTPWLARDKDVAKDLTKKKHVAGRVNDIINKALAIRDEFGGETSWGNSDARQRLDVLQEQLVILQKGGTEGMSSDEDMKKLSKALGASDLASFRDRSAGLIEGRDSSTAALNSELVNNGYTGPLIAFPNMYAGGARKRGKAEEEFKKDLTWGTNQALYGKTLDVAKAQSSAFPEEDVRGYSNEQMRKAQTHAAALKDESKTPEQRDAARKQLELLSTKADSPGYRKFAAGLLKADAPAPVAEPRFK
jgi:hypothetical protein